MILVCFQGKPCNITVIQVYAPTTHFFIEKVYAFLFQRRWSWSVLWKPIRPSRTNTKKEDVLFITGDWNAKVRSQEIPRIKGKFALGVQNEEGQRLTEFCQENALVIGKPSSNNTRETLRMYTTRWLIPKSDWLYSLQPKIEKLYTVSKKQDLELTVAQIISSLLQNSGLNSRK